MDGRGTLGSATPATDNRLLDALSRERPGLRAHFDPVRFRAGATLCCEGGRAAYVFFPLESAASTIIHLEGGAANETLQVGREGMVGLSVWLGLARSIETVVQPRPGEVMRIAAAPFCRLVTGNPQCRSLLHEFTAYALRAQAQLVACNASHSAEQRIARWLLGAADRCGGTSVHVPQLALARALGLRRQTVGEVALRLQRSRLIAYRRGVIQLLDRAGLEALSCECYATLQARYARLVRLRGTH